MTHYLRLKGLALGGIVGVYGVIQLVSTMANSDAHLNYAQYAEKMIPVIAQTSDAVPLPACRSSYINLSPDDNYPIPHWVYSLPEDADKALILAIAKTESRFKPFAESHRGAIGLMQLMPATAKYMVGKKPDFLELVSMNSDVSSIDSNGDAYTPKNPFDFKDPFVSLAIGTQYIHYLQDKKYIGDNLVYTLAAYNAGPSNLLEWKRRFGTRSEEAFIKAIPFKETRNYVRKVMKDYNHYKTLLPDIKDTVWVSADNC
jgi:soluble lytic murein transglycosylase-like protein